MFMTIQSSVKEKILATPSETSKVENTSAEMLRDLDQQMEKRADDGCTLWIKLYSKYKYETRYHSGKANVVIEALRGKEQVKPRRVRAMAMTIKFGVRGMILAAQSEAFKQENGMMRTVVIDEAHASSLRYLSENEIESPWILSVNFQGQSSEYDVIWVMEWNFGDDQLRLRWMIYLVVLADDPESVRDAIRFVYCLTSLSGWTNIRCAPFEALYGRKCRSPVLWAEIGESSLIGPELVQETTDKVVLIKEKLKAARDRQKSCADNRRKPLEFEVGDRVMLKVSPWKGVIRFGKKGKLAPRQFLFDELRGQVVNDIVTQLKVLTSFLEEGEVHVVGWFFSLGVVMLLFVPLCGQAKLLAVRYRVKVCWNSKRGPEFTWEREDFMKSKYP
ncbi:hypothetical protein Tco_0922752 [Tanacetum coccineum]|uniref:Reverse transcriptase domain-containing protein n=1 Tax=Tanacetum coccineum TaxID=301880 RepID=A0ABQ5D012_9ASTR